MPAYPCLPRLKSTPGRRAGIIFRHPGGMGTWGTGFRWQSVRTFMPATVMVSQDHVFGNRNKQRRIDVFRLAVFFRERADGRGRRPIRAAIAEQAVVPGLTAGQGLEHPVVALCSVGGHDGSLSGGKAGRLFSGPQDHPVPPGPNLLKVGLRARGERRTGGAGRHGKGLVCRCPDRDRYSECFVLPVNNASTNGLSNDFGTDARDVS